MTIEEMETRFSRARSFDRAAKIVLDRRVCHPIYQHYTKLDSVLTKIRQRRWFLTRCSSSKMNDLQEPLKFDGGTGALKRSYVTCFGHSKSESVAMWGIYGKSDRDAMRVTISGEVLEKWMSEIECRDCEKDVGRGARGILDVKTSDGKTTLQRNVCAAVFRDILYVAVSKKKDELDEYDIRRSNSVRWGGGYYHFSRDEDIFESALNGQYAGFIKDIEWSYEEETRLCVRLRRKINDDNISVAIPHYVIEDMRFTFSPWLKKEEEEKVRGELKAALKTAGVHVESKTFQRFRRSALCGALNFK